MANLVFNLDKARSAVFDMDGKTAVRYVLLPEPFPGFAKIITTHIEDHAAQWTSTASDYTIDMITEHSIPQELGREAVDGFRAEFASAKTAWGGDALAILLQDKINGRYTLITNDDYSYDTSGYKFGGTDGGVTVQSTVRHFQPTMLVEPAPVVEDITDDTESD